MLDGMGLSYVLVVDTKLLLVMKSFISWYKRKKKKIIIIIIKRRKTTFLLKNKINKLYVYIWVI